MIIFGSSLVVVVVGEIVHSVLVLSSLRNLLHEQLGHQFWSQNNETGLHLGNESKDGFLGISCFKSTSIFHFRFGAEYIFHCVNCISFSITAPSFVRSACLYKMIIYV